MNNFKFVRSKSQKMNCWEYVGCGREMGGKNAHLSGVCRASMDTSADGINEGENGGRICWAVSGTFCGERMDGRYAKKILSCRSCDFFHKVRNEEGSAFQLNKSYSKTTPAQMAGCI